MCAGSSGLALIRRPAPRNQILSYRRSFQAPWWCRRPPTVLPCASAMRRWCARVAHSLTLRSIWLATPANEGSEDAESTSRVGATMLDEFTSGDDREDRRRWWLWLLLLLVLFLLVGGLIVANWSLLEKRSSSRTACGPTNCAPHAR